MNCFELKVARQRCGRSQAEVAKVIGKSVDSYCKKERGFVGFSADEVVGVVKVLNLDLNSFNAIFYDGCLPFADSMGVR